MTKKLWGGRFKKKTDARFERFSESFRWDRRLLPYDLQIAAAHVTALGKVRVLSGAEAKRLLKAIATLEKKYEAGLLRLNPDSEDVHSAVHAELLRLAGPLADKLHAGRSRNDLVSQSSRLYVKDEAGRLIVLISELQQAIVSKAETYQSLLIPGMTHLQNAQVVSVAHIFLSYAEMLQRAKLQLETSQYLADVCVLGSGALAGVTFNLDQRLIAKKLGLSRITNNSYDVSGDRDFILSLLAGLSFLGVHLSRISEDLMLGQTKGFSTMDIDAAFCTGSSMMPQKKNADFLELARGASGIFAGNFISLLTTLKSLPTSYNRDLQWDKRCLFESVESATELLSIFKDVFRTLKVNAVTAKSQLSDENIYATDLADYLVRKGIPFKVAHDQVGRIVSFAEENRLPISRIGLDLLRKFAPKLDGDIYSIFDPAYSVRQKKTIGSTNPVQIKNQLRSWKKRLGNASL